MSSNAAPVLLPSTSIRAIKKGYANTPDGQVHYWEAGSGPALLLVHQSSSNAEEYAAMVPYLADRYHVIAYDWPGHGNSTDPSTELGVEGYSDAGVAVLDHLGVDKFHVLGHHGGALIAMNLGWTLPDRVEKLILCGTSGVKKQEETEAFTESLDLEKRHHVDREGKSLSDTWSRFTQYMPHSSAKEILITYLGNLAARLRPYDAHYGVLKWDRRPALESIKNREILLTQGVDDEYVSHQETLLDTLPNAIRTPIEDAGAFLFFEKPEACAKLIAEFLEK